MSFTNDWASARMANQASLGRAFGAREPFRGGGAGRQADPMKSDPHAAFSTTISNVRPTAASASTSESIRELCRRSSRRSIWGKATDSRPEFRLADAFLAHGSVKRDLGGGERGQGDELPPLGFRARDVLARRHKAHDRGLDRLHRAGEGIDAVGAERDGFGNVRHRDKQATVVVGREFYGVARRFIP